VPVRDAWIWIAAIAVWLVLNRWLLPRMGVPT